MQRCNKDSAWELFTGDGDFKEACAKGQIPAPGAPATPPGQCAYHDVQYAPGAVICVAPSLALTCGTGKDGVSATSAAADNRACANAQIPAPAASATSTTTPPGLCTYHDVHYATGAVICVAPHFGQTCGMDKDGVWSLIQGGDIFKIACATPKFPLLLARHLPPSRVAGGSQACVWG